MLEEEYEDGPEEGSEEENGDYPGEEFAEPFEEERGQTAEETEEEEEAGEPEEVEEEPVQEEQAEEYGADDGDFVSGPSETYRDYDLDEILKGLEYMTNGQTEEAVGSSDVLPDDDADIVDALKKKFGDVSDGLPEDAGEDVADNGDFYEDEEHEDGESFDPNSFLRFRK